MPRPAGGAARPAKPGRQTTPSLTDGPRAGRGRAETSDDDETSLAEEHSGGGPNAGGARRRKNREDKEHGNSTTNAPRSPVGTTNGLPHASSWGVGIPRERTVAPRRHVRATSAPRVLASCPAEALFPWVPMQPCWRNLGSAARQGPSSLRRRPTKDATVKRNGRGVNYEQGEEGEVEPRWDPVC